MKKISLVLAVSLMTSVAFGQVNWGTYEKDIPKNVRELVEKAVQNSASSCAMIARNSGADVIAAYVEQSDFSDQPIHRITLDGGLFSTMVVDVEAVDLYHSDKYKLRKFVCVSDEL